MKRFLTAMTLVSIAASTAAYAQQARYACTKNQEIILDFARGPNNVPLLNIDRDIISQKSVSTPTTYRIDGMPGVYDSEADAMTAFNAFRALKRLKVPAPDLVTAYSYLEQLETTGKTAAAPKK